jgi:hypothetical protein
MLVLMAASMQAEDAVRSVKLITFIASSRPEHAHRLCASQVLSRALSLLSKDPPQQLAVQLIQLIGAAGSLRLEPSETRSLLRLSCATSQAAIRSLLLEQIMRTAKGFDGDGGGCGAYARLLGAATLSLKPVGMRGWPPVAGWGFACWLRVESWGGKGLRILRLAAIKGEGDKGRAGGGAHISEIWANRDGQGFVSLQTGASSWVQFSSFSIQPGEWYHIAVCHTQNTLHANVAALYVNGSLREQREIRSPASLKDAVLSQVQGIVGQATELQCTFGGAEADSGPSGAATTTAVSATATSTAAGNAASALAGGGDDDGGNYGGREERAWRIKSAVVTDEPLSCETISGMFLVGRSYNGYFQGDLPERDRSWVQHTALLYTSVDVGEEVFAPHEHPWRILQAFASIHACTDCTGRDSRFVAARIKCPKP